MQNIKCQVSNHISLKSFEQLPYWLQFIINYRAFQKGGTDIISQNSNEQMISLLTLLISE